MLTRPQRSVVTLLLALALTPLVACTKNAATGRSQFNALSREQEIQIGEEEAPKMLQQSGGQIPDPVVQQYVREVGQRLAAVSEKPDLPWEFFTLNTSIVNAFALPGGKVFISRGLLEKMSNEAQLAGVLGHEVGHVTARHANDRVTNQVLTTIGVVGVSVAAGQSDNDAVRYGAPAAAGAAGTLWTLGYSRSQENESDSLGLRYMTKAGYNPMAQVQVMEILHDASGGAGGIEWLQTHPLPESRIRDVTRTVEGKYAYAVNNPDFRFGEQAFKQNVLDRLAQLPPAPDGAKQDG